jgi:hypothetical protein
MFTELTEKRENGLSRPVLINMLHVQYIKSDDMGSLLKLEGIPVIQVEEGRQEIMDRISMFIPGAVKETLSVR